MRAGPGPRSRERMPLHAHLLELRSRSMRAAAALGTVASSGWLALWPAHLERHDDLLRRHSGSLTVQRRLHRVEALTDHHRRGDGADRSVGGPRGQDLGPQSLPHGVVAQAAAPDEPVRIPARRALNVSSAIVTLMRVKTGNIAGNNRRRPANPSRETGVLASTVPPVRRKTRRHACADPAPRATAPRTGVPAIPRTRSSTAASSWWSTTTPAPSARTASEFRGEAVLTTS